MGLNNILKVFVPKEKAFFPLFEQGAENLVAICSKLKDLIRATDESTRTDSSKAIKELEVAGDKITYTIYETLSTT
jgi:uncharacterized protein